MTYFLAALAASGAFIFAGWRSKRARDLAAGQARVGVPDDTLWGEDEIDVTVPDSLADVAAAIRPVLQRLAPAMALQSVKAEIAVPPGLLVRMRASALADLLEELLTVAVHGAPGSRLLLTAAMHGDRIHIGVTDDMPCADPAVRKAKVRGVMQQAATRGASLDVAVRPAEGTTMTLRLARAIDEREDIEDRPVRHPARGSMAPFSIGG